MGEIRVIFKISDLQKVLPIIHLHAEERDTGKKVNGGLEILEFLW
jgi:hypothetical protein